MNYSEISHIQIHKRLDKITAGEVAQIWENPEVEEYLSFCWWERHLQWLHVIFNWEAAFDRGSTWSGKNTHHRTIERLKRFVGETSLANAHFGLTSSDVEDNVRRSMLSFSLRGLTSKLKKLVESQSLTPYESMLEQPAFTHWQEAGQISILSRIQSSWMPLSIESNNIPIMHGKMMAGAIGDYSALKMLATHTGHGTKEINSQMQFPWNDFLLASPWNSYPIQSSDHFDELDAIHWIVKVSSQLHKIALDIRFLASHKWIVFDQPKNYIGSSSIKNKSNPYALEKICSISRSIMHSHHQVASVLAHNGCERTLDTSWQLKTTLSESVIKLDKILTTFLNTKFRYVSSSLRESVPPAYVKQVLEGGITRMEAFKSENNTSYE